MACPDIDNFLATEANRISSKTSYKPWTTTPWNGNDIVPKTVWPVGMGDTPNFLTYERSTPSTEFSFQEYGFNDGGEGDGGGSCNPPTVTVYQAETRRTMALKIGAINSDWICYNDAMMSWNVAQQAAAKLRNLEANSANIWQNARRDEFTRIASNKAVLDSSMTTGTTTFGTGTIGQLVREPLDYWYDQLVADGAEQNNGLATTEWNQPVLPLIMSREALTTLQNNGETRQDLRWNSDGKNNQLTGPRGSISSLNGYKILIDIQAARWNLVNGAWVRVPFYLPNTPGQPTNKNPAYNTAQYEDLYIASPHVVSFAIPPSSLNAGPLTFPAQDYMGNFRWVNEYDLECNVDRNRGFFRGVLGYGAQPGIPEYGVVLRFRRCPLAWTVDSTCS